jgi:hypothetical protein
VVGKSGGKKTYHFSNLLNLLFAPAVNELTFSRSWYWVSDNNNPVPLRWFNQLITFGVWNSASIKTAPQKSRYA